MLCKMTKGIVNPITAQTNKLITSFLYGLQPKQSTNNPKLSSSKLSSPGVLCVMFLQAI